MNEDFINAYIDVNNKKIEELVRSDLLNQTRITIAEKMIAKLNEENKKLNDENKNLRDQVSFMEEEKLKLAEVKRSKV